MTWRGVMISEPARIFVDHGRLCLRRETEEEASLPLEDAAFLVLDTQRTTISGATLSACAAQGCLVIVCDERHMPCGALLPYNQYYRQTETTQAQLALTLPRKKKLWQKIVCYKIRNQASCLSYLGATQEQIRRVAVLEQKVGSGDPTNVEGQAARLYWGAYAAEFTRDTDGRDRINAMLNYGYALIRAVIARELAALGFITCLGLRHSSMENPFNLADDIIEPWRPFVDRLAMRHYRSNPGDAFSRSDRQALCSIFHEQVLFEDGESLLAAAIRRQTTMLRGWATGRRQIAFPDFPVRKTEDC